MTVADSSGPALTDQLAETWNSLFQMASRLAPADWDRPTACPGWSVKDHVAHIIGTEAMINGESPPDDTGGETPAHVRNEIAKVNERWVEAFRPLDPAEVLAEFRRVTNARLATLRALPEGDWDAPSWTPVGQADYRRFMQIRVFDSYVHEQDVRAAVDKPGHLEGPAAEQSLDEVERALGYLVGKKAGAPEGARVTIEVSGPLERTIHVAVDGRAKVVNSLDRPADVTIELGSSTLLPLACGRVAPGEVAVTMEGNQELGRRIVEALPFTI